MHEFEKCSLRQKSSAARLSQRMDLGRLSKKESAVTVSVASAVIFKFSG